MASKKREVLRRRSEFEFIRENGRRVRPVDYLILNYLVTDQKVLRCGWTIPKKTGSAVVRNRLKRWCREYFRNHEDDSFPSIDLNIVVLGTRGKEYYKKLSHSEFKGHLDKGWKTLKKRL